MFMGFKINIKRGPPIPNLTCYPARLSRLSNGTCGKTAMAVPSKNIFIVT